MKYEELIPFVSENFITVPLWEEGDYTPYINFWLDKDKVNAVYGCGDIEIGETKEIASGWHKPKSIDLYVTNTTDGTMLDLMLCIPGEYDIQKLIDRAGKIINKTNAVWQEKGTEIEFKGNDLGNVEKLHSRDGVSLKFPVEVFVNINEDDLTIKSVKCWQGMKLRDLDELPSYIIDKAKSQGLVKEVEVKESDEIVRFRIHAIIHAQIVNGSVITSGIEYNDSYDRGYIHNNTTLENFILTYKEKSKLISAIQNDKTLTFGKLEDRVIPNPEFDYFNNDK